MLERQRKMPSFEELIEKYPLSPSGSAVKRERDSQIRAVLAGQSEKMLVVVGPCSAHDKKAVLEYAERLGKVALKTVDKLVIVPRIYTNKPRTKGVGYKGMFLQPDPLREADIVEGMESVRALLLAVLECSGLTAADEILYPESAALTQDLLSYHTVGARSVENPLHRQTASGLDLPVGMKNPISGNLEGLVHSVYAAQSPQIFPFDGWQVKSFGNEYAHAILRGYVNALGEDVANFDKETVCRLGRLYLENGIKNPAVIVDCSHSNSAKQYKRQPSVAMETLKNRRESGEVKALVKGLMIESFLCEGSQAESGIAAFGQSITDPCLGWEDTERLLLRIAEKV